MFKASVVSSVCTPTPHRLRPIEAPRHVFIVATRIRCGLAALAALGTFAFAFAALTLSGALVGRARVGRALAGRALGGTLGIANIARGRWLDI